MNNRRRQQQKAIHMIAMSTKRKCHLNISFTMLDMLFDVIRKVGETALKLAYAFKEMQGLNDSEVDE